MLQCFVIRWTPAAVIVAAVDDDITITSQLFQFNFKSVGLIVLLLIFFTISCETFVYLLDIIFRGVSEMSLCCAVWWSISNHSYLNLDHLTDLLPFAVELLNSSLKSCPNCYLIWIMLFHEDEVIQGITKGVYLFDGCLLPFAPSLLALVDESSLCTWITYFSIKLNLKRNCNTFLPLSVWILFSFNTLLIVVAAVIVVKEQT